MPLKGQRMTQATKDRISTSRKGITAWNKGKQMPNETKTKISQTKKGQEPWNKNRAWSNKVKKKISKTKLVPESKFNKLYSRLVLKFKSDFLKIDKQLEQLSPDIKTVECPWKNMRETLPTHIRHCIHHAEHPLGYTRQELIESTRVLSKLKL